MFSGKENTNEEKSRENDIAINQNGQSAMLQKIVRQTYGIVIVGIVFLIVFLGINLYSEQCRGEQLENTVYLNKYACVYYNVCSICMKNMLVNLLQLKNPWLRLLQIQKIH